MRRLLVILLAFASLSLRGQDPSSDALKSQLLSFSRKVAALDCDFVQTKESSLLSDKAVSGGRMQYARPARLIWEYTEPFQLRVSSDDTQNRFIREMMRLVVSNIEGDFLTDGKLFEAEASLAGDEITVVLLPQKKELKKMWSKLVLRYDKNTMHATQFEMVEVSGDRTLVQFSNVKYVVSE